MSDSLSNSVCLVANRFLAQCKSKLSIVSRNCPNRCIVRLKNSAYCEISKCCDVKKESSFITRLGRAFFVVTDANKYLKDNFGELKCDFCESPEVPDKHTGAHRSALFNIDRIREYPAICIRNDTVSEQAYATIEPEITFAVSQPNSS